MFEFKPIASGSSGNCHYLKTDDASGLIDAGIQWKRMQKAIGFKTSSLDFVLATHRHHDHSGYIKDAIMAGIDVYAIQDVWESNGINSHRAHTITPMKQFHIKSLTILPLPVPHDVENVGFLITDKKGESLVYLTDCCYSPFYFGNLAIIAIECNYSKEILSENVYRGLIAPELRNQIIASHFSLENLKNWLRACDLSKVREIWLIHLSEGNGDRELFKKEIMALTGKPVKLA